MVRRVESDPSVPVTTDTLDIFSKGKNHSLYLFTLQAFEKISTMSPASITFFAKSAWNLALRLQKSSSRLALSFFEISLEFSHHPSSPPTSTSQAAFLCLAGCLSEASSSETSDKDRASYLRQAERYLGMCKEVVKGVEKDAGEKAYEIITLQYEFELGVMQGDWDRVKKVIKVSQIKERQVE